MKNSSPPPTVGQQITNSLPTGHLQVTNSLPTGHLQVTNSLPTGHLQVTNRLPTVGKNTREKIYFTETYVKTNKTYQKRRTKSEKDQILEKRGLDTNVNQRIGSTKR